MIKIVLDPARPEGVIIDLNDAIIPIHPYYDFARNLKIARICTEALLSKNCDDIRSDEDHDYNIHHAEAI